MNEITVRLVPCCAMLKPEITIRAELGKGVHMDVDLTELQIERVYRAKKLEYYRMDAEERFNRFCSEHGIYDSGVQPFDGYAEEATFYAQAADMFEKHHNDTVSADQTWDDVIQQVVRKELFPAWTALLKEKAKDPATLSRMLDHLMRKDYDTAPINKDGFDWWLENTPPMWAVTSLMTEFCWTGNDD